MAMESCVIVGAGIAGLLAAGRLQEAGVQAVVLDKGKKPGGRMASRHVGDCVFDTGAQFFTVRDTRFQGLLDGWMSQGLAAQWGNGFAGGDLRVQPDGHPRYRALPYMRALCETLADGLEVRCTERVTQLEAVGGAWRVGTESGGAYEGQALVLTLPVPQALDLLEGCGVSLPNEALAVLRPIAYDPCFAVMARLKGPSAIPEPGGIRMPAVGILWMADNQAKGVSPAAPSVTIHAAPEYSRAHLEDDPDTVATDLLGAASEYLGGEVEEAFIHRWRYSQPVRCHGEEFLPVDAGAPLFFAGDGFGAPRVEGAALSGLAAAEGLLSAGRPL